MHGQSVSDYFYPKNSVSNIEVGENVKKVWNPINNLLSSTFLKIRR